MKTDIAERVAKGLVTASMVERVALSIGGRYAPEGSVEEAYPEVGLVVYVSESNGVPYGVAYAGKSNKPMWNYRFRTEEQRKRLIEDTVYKLKKSQEAKQQRQQERQEFRHGLKVGDVLYSSWGYDQTNVDFYQVVEVGEKSVKIREIDSKAHDDSHVMPAIGHFKGPAMTKIVRQGDSVRINSFSGAYKWDGKPEYVTPFGMGH